MIPRTFHVWAEATSCSLFLYRSETDNRAEVLGEAAGASWRGKGRRHIGDKPSAIISGQRLNHDLAAVHISIRPLVGIRQQFAQRHRAIGRHWQRRLAVNRLWKQP